MLNVTIVSYGNFPLKKFEETEMKKYMMVLFVLTERKSVRKRDGTRTKCFVFLDLEKEDIGFKGLFIE